MAQELTKDVALALLANSLATGAILVVLISVLSPISGAHFNPVVSFAALLQREFTTRQFVMYSASQLLGGLVGVAVAHAMFAKSTVQLSETVRSGPGQWLAEAVATFGLVATIIAAIRVAPRAIPWLVGLYITSAYWFTASTSFANPAVTIARAFTSSFAGIRLIDVPLFMAAQFVGGAVAVKFMLWLLQGVAPAQGVE